MPEFRFRRRTGHSAGPLAQRRAGRLQSGFGSARLATAPTIKLYDEALWAQTSDNQEPVEVSLTLLENLHHRWSRLLHSMKESDYTRTLVHPETGVVPLHRQLAIYAWHGRHHTAHITALRERNGWK